jgi:hypothetical protein
MKEVTLTAATQLPLCDFCSAPGIYANYPARSFTAWELQKQDGSTMNVNSQSDWAACKACASLIDANEWDALVERSILWFRRNWGAALPEAELRSAITDLHRRFRENRQETH